MSTNGWLVADSDMHILEPPDLWTRYMDPRWRYAAPIGLTELQRDMRVKVKNRVIARLSDLHPGAYDGLWDESTDSVFAHAEALDWDAKSQLLAMDMEHLDSTVLFYKSVFGFEAEPAHELVDPYGLIQSRVLESRDRSIRLPLNTSASPRTATARLLAAYGGGGVHHIARGTGDIFATMAALRARNVPLLEIPGTYYDGLPALHDLPAGRIEEMRGLGILYDRSGAGEFFHAYTRSFDGRFFFEIVERRGYEGFGAVNASVRLAAQALSERAEFSLDALGELAL